MATSLIGLSTIDSLVKQIDALGNFIEPRVQELPVTLFECYCKANEKYRVPVVEYSCGTTPFIEHALRDILQCCKDIYSEDKERAVFMRKEHLTRLTQQVGERLYGNRQTEQA
jgi:hypothetical protein